MTLVWGKVSENEMKTAKTSFYKLRLQDVFDLPKAFVLSLHGLEGLASKDMTVLTSLS